MLFIGIHAPILASAPALKDSSKDVSKKNISATNVLHKAKITSNRGLPRCGVGFRLHQKGVASWYGDYFHGKPMANQEPFDMHKNTVAHRTLKLGTKVCLQNPENGKVILATVTDRGPYPSKFGPYKAPRVIDVSKAIAEELGFEREGTTHVAILVHSG